MSLLIKDDEKAKEIGGEGHEQAIQDPNPILPELITEIDDLKLLDEVVRDAVNAVIDLYEDMGKELPSGLLADGLKSPVWFESLISAEP